MTDLRHRTSELQKCTSSAQSEVASCKHELDVANRQLAALKASKSQAEERSRHELEQLHTAHEKEMAALMAKLERKVDSYEQTIKDAEAMIDNKDKLLARWKEEAMVVSINMLHIVLVTTVSLTSQ